MTDTVARVEAITGALSSDGETMQNVEQVEQYITQNKGVIMGCLSSLPGPMLGTVRGIVKIFLLTPLKYLLTLPLTKISQVLEDFAKNEAACPPPPLPTSASDCAPTQIV